MRFSQLLAASCLLVLSSSAPQRRRNQNVNTKFFTDDIVWQNSEWKERIGFRGDVLAIKVNTDP